MKILTIASVAWADWEMASTFLVLTPKVLVVWTNYYFIELLPIAKKIFPLFLFAFLSLSLLQSNGGKVYFQLNFRVENFVLLSRVRCGTWEMFKTVCDWEWSTRNINEIETKLMQYSYPLCSILFYVWAWELCDALVSHSNTSASTTITGDGRLCASRWDDNILVFSLHVQFTFFVAFDRMANPAVI